MFYKNLCENCGGSLNQTDSGHYACEYCGVVYSVERVENYLEKVNSLFDDMKLELISNARKNLYNAVTAQYISNEEVHECCAEVKKYLPDDFAANFYDTFVSKTSSDIAKLIRQIDVKEQYDNLEPLLNFLIRSLESDFINDTAFLIERAYKNTDLTKYSKYSTLLSEEAVKHDECIYDTNYPRDVFVAYSSKDIDKVLELVSELENEQGLSCFISIRNLRHGAGSRENYESALKEAIDNCRSFVFVSSMNSRNASCDALKVELPYVKKKDIENAPGDQRNDYSKIAHRYKKPRIEYRIEESTRTLASDRIVDEFFSGYERVYTPIDVAERVMRQAMSTGEEFSSVKIDSGVKQEEQISVQREEKEQTRESSEGLAFELNADGRGYTLVSAENCTKAYITIDQHKGLPVTAIGDKAFQKCINIMSITTPYSITSIGEYAFCDCSSLTSVSIPDSVTSIANGAFSGCSELKSITIPASVISIGDRAFFECKNLTSITIPKSVTSIGDNAFFGCENLTSITIPDSVLSIGEHALKRCNNLNRVSLSFATTKKNSVENITFKHLFGGAVPHTIQTVDITGGTRVENGAFEDCKSIRRIVLSEGITYIGDSAFANCKSLKSVGLPEGVISIGEKAFFSCTSLSIILIPRSVISIGNDAFCGCKNLQYVFCFKKYAYKDSKHENKLFIYSETKQPFIKNFFNPGWHYVNGVPTLW